MIVKGKQDRPDYYGMVAAAVVDPDNQIVARLNRPGKDGKRIHAEHAAMLDYKNKYGDIPEGSIVVTTLSPCNEQMAERDGPSCTELINNSVIKKVYCGYMDPTQDDDTRQFNLMETADKGIRNQCKQFADTFLDKLDETLNETAMMGKIADSGKIIRILKKAHTVPYSDEKNWLLVDMDPAKGNKGLGIKWIPADTRFEWVRPYRDTVEQGVAEEINPDILDPRFSHTQQIGDYTYIASVEIFLDEPILNIKAYDGDKEIGHVLFEIFDWEDDTSNSYMESGGTEVDPKYRGKGIATTMYAYAKMLGNDIIPSFNRTTQGKAMWAGWGQDAKHLRDVAEGQYDKAETYRAHLIKTLPQIMKLFANIGKGWIPSKEQMLSAVDTAYIVMKHTGDAKQAGKVLMDELNTLYRMSQGKKGIDENFADGRNPQDKGDSKRHGVPTKASVSTLRKVAKQGGRKGQLSHWMANMKAGRNK